jgi:peptide alpha-N-acetyltransferase
VLASCIILHYYASTKRGWSRFFYWTLIVCFSAFPILVFTYRYFLYRFPQLCILAVNEADEPIGCVVGKMDEEEVSIPFVIPIGEQQKTEFETETTTMVGYIGMLAVSEHYRRRGIGKALVRCILRRMRAMGCTSATLETEVTNVTAQQLYQDIFGFIRE